MGGFRSPEIREPEPGCEQLGVPRGVAIDGSMPRAQELKLWHSTCLCYAAKQQRKGGNADMQRLNARLHFLLQGQCRQKVSAVQCTSTTFLGIPTVNTVT